MESKEKNKNKVVDSLQLPCGLKLKNRLIKAAISECLANTNNDPGQDILNLYRTWKDTGVSLDLSGNIMIDRSYLEHGRNVVLDHQSNLDKFKTWTETVRSAGKEFWAQLNHPGRQTNIFVNVRPIAPSAVRVKKILSFAPPRAMEKSDIDRVIEQFRISAGLAKSVGFSGVQIHSAHGYLLGQFLSPHSNRRDDEWGGSFENRTRLLFEVIRTVRTEVGSQFPVGLKINSADFQKGGWSEEESAKLISLLNEEPLDMVEISGGTYEKIAFVGEHRKSTQSREAYFLKFAKSIRERIKKPLMVTGGFSSSEGIQDALIDGGVDLIGLARPLILNPHFAQAVLQGRPNRFVRPEIKVRVDQLRGMAEAGWYAHQLSRLSQRKPIDYSFGGLQAVGEYFGQHALFGLRQTVVRNLSLFKK